MEKFHNVKYKVEIYQPGKNDNVIAYFNTLLPIVIGVGDWINQVSFPEALFGSIKATNIDHIIWKDKEGTLIHKTCVYTEESKDK